MDPAVFDIIDHHRISYYFSGLRILLELDLRTVRTT
jgi:hypothetical protein